MRDRFAVWLCNLIMSTVATSTYRDRFKRLAQQKIHDTLAEALQETAHG